MKKFLSLALALIMTMSLVTISASADFTDDDAISYSEAVDVMAAIEVIGGYTDGSFDPEATLTRGAAAKIICNMLLGPTTAEALGADTAPFPDVAADHVFAGYIAYCAQQGIINGYADGLFYPSGEVTGFQFMKMLLGALGYDSTKEGFTGDNWSVAVAKIALETGLDDGNDDFVGSAAVTREEACQYAFNTLKSAMVAYGSNFSITLGDATVSDTSKAEKVTTGATSEIVGLNSNNDNYLEFGEKYFTNLNRTGTTDDFGHPVNTWKIKTTKIDTYRNDGDLIAVYTSAVSMADLYTLVGSDVLNNIVTTPTGGTDTTLTTWVDGSSVAVDVIPTTVFYKNNSGDAANTGNGTITEVYLDSDGNVTLVHTNTYLFQASADYSTSLETVRVSQAGDTAIILSNSALSSDDFDVEDVEADDYLLVTAVIDAVSGRYVAKTVEPAEKITGTVTTYTVGKNITVDGEQYKYSATASTLKSSTSYSVGMDTMLVLDSYGYVIEIEDAVVATNYVYIAENVYQSGLSSTSIATAYFTDGTCEEITIAKVDDVTATDTNDYAWYTYSKNSSGEYKLYTNNFDTNYSASTNDGITYAAGTGDTLMVNNSVYFMPELDTLKTLKANSSTLIMVRDSDNEVFAYTGVANAPDITANATAVGLPTAVDYVYNTSTGYAVFVFVDLYNNVGATDVSIVDGTASDDYIFILKSDGQTYVDENETYYTYKVVTEDGEGTLTFDYQPTVNKLYYKARTNSDGHITSMTELDTLVSTKYLDAQNATSAISESGGTLTIGGSPYTLADDVSINLVNRASVLMYDKGADYEVAQGLTAKSLVSLLSGYTCTYDYNIELTEAGNTCIQTLYVDVSAASQLYTITTAGAVTKGNITVTATPAVGSAAAGTIVTVVVSPSGSNAAVTTANNFVLIVEDTAGVKQTITNSGGLGTGNSVFSSSIASGATANEITFTEKGTAYTYTTTAVYSYSFVMPTSDVTIFVA